jgi:hypothetical protein
MGKEIEFDAEKEFEGINFNEKRLEKRFIKTMETLSRNPDQSIWTCSESHAEASETKFPQRFTGCLATKTLI